MLLVTPWDRSNKSVMYHLYLLLNTTRIKRILFVILCVASISCESDKIELKTLDLEKFTIEVPSTWTATPQQGFDSFVGQIDITAQEKVNFDLGFFANKLNVDPATHDIQFITIDDKRAKVVRPKNGGKGIIGVYFDSLEVTKTNKFQISSTSLSSHNQKLFLNAMRTLKFKN